MPGLMNLLTQRATLFRGQTGRTALLFTLTGILGSTLTGRQIARSLRSGLLLVALRRRRGKRKVCRAGQDQQA